MTERMYVWIEQWMDGWMECLKGWMDRSMDGCMHASMKDYMDA